MVALELKSAAATVRVHDDLCGGSPEERLLCLERLVGETHKRRYLAERQSVIQEP
ncbi:MAG: hypothetical protein LJU34_07605 [Oscillospiraceae bacterium]|nr:hypothetical protein [Oscillospiraceae bacterium]